MELKALSYLVAWFVVASYIATVSAISFQEDTAISAKQAETLFKFKDRVRSRLPHKYMQENIFLIKWLRASNFDIPTAEKNLLKHMQWRKDNKVDNIDNEDWQDFQTEFPWNLAGVDKEGRPLVQIVLKDWDIRQAAVTGRRGRLLRWVYKYFEDGSKQVRRFQEQGKNVTRFDLIIDADGFNPVTHGCPMCMPLYFSIVGIYEQQYPGAVDAIHIVNTPEFFRTVVRLLWPLLSEETRNAIKFHGTDKNSWRKALLSTIDNSQLIPAFGGSMQV